MLGGGLHILDFFLSDRWSQRRIMGAATLVVNCKSDDEEEQDESGERKAKNLLARFWSSRGEEGSWCGSSHLVFASELPKRTPWRRAVGRQARPRSFFCTRGEFLPHHLDNPCEGEESASRRGGECSRYYYCSLAGRPTFSHYIHYNHRM